MRACGLAAFGLVAWLAAPACSRSHAATGDTPDAAPAPWPAAPSSSSSTSSSVGANKAFGEPCVEDGECAGAVCFHKRLKGANPEPERRDARDEAVEHDGYCSMRCDKDSDCPVPPTRGRCGARGMCKRNE